EAKVTLPAGDHRIVLQEIPAVADPNSVRVTGMGTGGMTIGGVEIAQDFRPANLTPEYRALEKEIADFTGQMSLLDDRQKSINALREFLSSLKASAGTESSKDLLTRGFAVDSWQKAFQFLSDRLNDLSAEERSLAPRRKELGEKIEIARQKLSQLASQGGIQRWTAMVLISAPRGGEMTLKAMYLAHSASWLPLYDARLDPASGKVEIIWQAQVTQNTGEDWKDVGVTLSTTRPAAGIDLPKLASISLVPIQVHYPGAKGRSKQEFISGMPVLGTDYQDILTLTSGVTDANAGAGVNAYGARESDVPTTPAAEPAASLGRAEGGVARRDVAVTFELPGKLDIPSDAQPHKHRVASRDLEGKTEYHTIPRLNPAVFLVSKATLSGDIPLLPGRVQHFVGPDLVGSSWMADHAAGEEFPLSFGPDDRLKAERKSIWRKVEQKGKDDETDYKFLTTLENHLGRDAIIELKDRIPVSGDERITVTLDEKDTAPGFTKDPNEPGILTWNIPVPAGGKKELFLHYRIRAPRGLSIAGME
ncbi:MAG: mucoidy inhibitor MuiA family protein, partial [Acidobacteria bacterium]|nr:mucoidy inhibitor MuiA family protein [Acidobacteriota bacterium]